MGRWGYNLSRGTNPQPYHEDSFVIEHVLQMMACGYRVTVITEQNGDIRIVMEMPNSPESFAQWVRYNKKGVS